MDTTLLELISNHYCKRRTSALSFTIVAVNSYINRRQFKQQFLHISETNLKIRIKKYKELRFKRFNLRNCHYPELQLLHILLCI